MRRLTNQPFLTHGDRGHMCLLLHGLGGGVYAMQPLAEYLQARGYSTCGILYPGHDQPLPRMPESRWEDWFEHVVQTYDSLAQDYQQISVMGVSTGCILALKLALSRDRLQSLILMAPYLRIKRYPLLPPPEVLLYSLGYVLSNLPRLSLPVNDRDMRQAAQEVVFFQTFNLSAVRSANSLIQQVKPQVSQIRMPTLIFQSKRDTVVDPPGAQWLYDNLGGSNKSLEWLSQSNHVIPLDLERSQVFQKTQGFLESLEAGGDRDR